MDQVERILEAYGLPTGLATRSQVEGVANSVWFAGDYVVRVCKDVELLSDSYTESVAAPVAVAAGVLTPRMIAFDDSRQIVDSVFTIFERVEGETLEMTPHLSDPESFFFSLGESVRILHDRVKLVDDPNNFLDPGWTPNVVETIHRNPRRVPDYISQWVKDNHRMFPTEYNGDQVFAHQDLHPCNILVRDGRLASIIDWGDAGWSEPAVDLRYVPARYMESALKGYGDSPGLVTRARAHLLDQFLYALTMERSYGPMGDSSWDEVQAFLDKTA